MNEGFHRKIVDTSPDIATVIDPEGTITYVSPSVRDTLGYDPEELVGEDGFEFQDPAHREDVAEAIEAVAADPDATRTVETRSCRADGSWCWVESTLKNRIDDEAIGGILVNSRDISGRKSRERQHQKIASEYETLLETVEDGIFFIDVESSDAGHVFRFERVNRAYEAQTGLTCEEMEGKTPVEVFGDDVGAELESNYRRCVESREPLTYQEEVPVETAARIWQTNLAPVVADDEVARIIGITRNVTDRVERERQLQSQKEQLEEFAGVVSHDLRSPLTVAQGRVELLAEEYDSEHLPAIRRSLDRMGEIISDTLTLARQGQVVSDVEPIALVNLVGACWNGVTTEEATIAIDDEVTIYGDRSRLQHVFENLLRNAVEHGGAGVTVRVGRIDDRGIYLEDTGPGIPEDARERVFEPGESSASDGTGFGLTIVKRIAEAHSWTVEIVDSEDGGARFEFLGVDIDGA